MELTDSTKILEYVSNFQIKAGSIKRFEGNPYVNGDNIAEHLTRISRLLVCIASDLKNEFPEFLHLIEEALICILLHDDDEVIDGFDIPTALKNHNIKDEEEISKFKESVKNLSQETQDLLIASFSSFRRKDGLASKIAKALDNISGNQLVIEQKIGLINPDQAKFSIEYVKKLKGFSKTIDNLIDAQINQVLTEREKLLNDTKMLSKLPLNAKELLKIDLNSHELDKSKINVPLTEL